MHAASSPSMLDKVLGRGKPYGLRVTAGPNAGGWCPMDTDRVYLIGTDAHCDIILGDAQVGARHAAVTIAAGALTWRALDGALTSGDERIEPGESAWWPLEREVALGASRVTVVARGHRDAMRGDDLGAPIASDRAVEDDPASVDDAPQPFDAMRTTARVATVASVALAAALIGGGAAWHWMHAGDRAPDAPRFNPKTAQQRAADLMRDLNLPNLAVSSSDDRLHITGEVATRADLERAKNRLKLEGLPARFDVSTGEQMAERVQDILREHGLIVSAQYVEAGTVRLDGVTDASRKFDRAVQAALVDVAGLYHVIVGDTEVVPHPVAAANPEPSPAPKLGPADFNPAKRVTAIVEGDPPFLLTADGARYFEGAMLPMGYRIVSIRDQTVVVERDGEMKGIHF